MSDDWQVVEEALKLREPIPMAYRVDTLAALARLREREAQNDDVHQGWINRTNRAEARVAQLEGALREIAYHDGRKVTLGVREPVGPEVDMRTIARNALAHPEGELHPYYVARVAAGLPTTACPRCGKTDGYHSQNCPTLAHPEGEAKPAWQTGLGLDADADADAGIDKPWRNP